MDKTITFENNWSEEDKTSFMKYYVRRSRILRWIVFSLGVYFLIALIFGFIELHKKFTDFSILLYFDVTIMIAFPFLNHMIDKRQLNTLIKKHRSISLKADGLYVDDKHIETVSQAVISNQFIFFKVGRHSYIQTITKQEADDIMNILEGSPVFPIINTTKPFRITKFALTGRV